MVLKPELSMTKELLAKSAEESSNFTKQLEESQRVSAEFEAEMSSIRAQYMEEMSLLLGSLDDAKQKEEALVGHSLHKELVNVHKKAESVAKDMKEEKKLRSS
ncbi:hypothetical protein MLD38_007952 [Melastoma candidum]|uniref:Uncharacterized protein n=1 Tax=Melastoma candidum TaxID=119954 RepID=A0ACB9RVU4_9MYRT|nr:hypothetical protein MLD38_007952 [Melastoma candidum]